MFNFNFTILAERAKAAIIEGAAKYHADKDRLRREKAEKDRKNVLAFLEARRVQKEVEESIKDILRLVEISTAHGCNQLLAYEAKVGSDFDRKSRSNEAIPARGFGLLLTNTLKKMGFHVSSKFLCESSPIVRVEISWVIP